MTVIELPYAYKLTLELREETMTNPPPRLPLPGTVATTIPVLVVLHN